jgi:hypothetical protein
MIPIYAVISFLSFRFYKKSLYFETVRDCYEAFVIYSFFILLLTYLGDDDEMQRSKITGSDRRKLLSPLNCFYYNPMNENFLHYMKYGIIQYVAIKPLCTLAAVILEHHDLYCETAYDFHFGMIYITIINFFSASIALYCLVGIPLENERRMVVLWILLRFQCLDPFRLLTQTLLLYRSFSIKQSISRSKNIVSSDNVLVSVNLYAWIEHGVDKWTFDPFFFFFLAPFLKFMCVKMVVFFCYWQTIVISLVAALGKSLQDLSTWQCLLTD